MTENDIQHKSGVMLSLLLATSLWLPAFAQPTEYNFPPVDELTPNEGLQNPFRKPDGTIMQSMDEWPEQRAYLKAMLMHYQYGTIPPPPGPDIMSVNNISSEEVLNGRAVYERFDVDLTRNGQSLTMRCGLYRPNKPGKFPVVIKNDRGVTEDNTVLNMAMDMGYAIAKYSRTDLAVDDPSVRREGGIFELYPEYTWGAIGTWAWGYSLVINAFEDMETIDLDKIVSTGHSRGGKTALAGPIFDERIAIAGPNSSGLGGTASPRIFEPGIDSSDMQIILPGRQPHWWTPIWYDFTDKEELLPWDSHFHKMILAPRGLHNAHATGDLWANPYGTEITHRAAKEFYALMGAEENIALHWRPGGHAQNEIDWKALLDFADLYFYDRDNGNVFDTLTYPDAEVPITYELPSLTTNIEKAVNKEVQFNLEVNGIRYPIHDEVNSIQIMDMNGQLINDLRKTGGNITWDGKNQSGSLVPSGVYIAKTLNQNIKFLFNH